MIQVVRTGLRRARAAVASDPLLLHKLLGPGPLLKRKLLGPGSRRISGLGGREEALRQLILRVAGGPKYTIPGSSRCWGAHLLPGQAVQRQAAVVVPDVCP